MIAAFLVDVQIDVIGFFGMLASSELGIDHFGSIELFDEWRNWRATRLFMYCDEKSSVGAERTVEFGGKRPEQPVRIFPNLVWLLLSKLMLRLTCCR